MFRRSEQIKKKKAIQCRINEGLLINAFSFSTRENSLFCCGFGRVPWHLIGMIRFQQGTLSRYHAVRDLLKEERCPPYTWYYSYELSSTYLKKRSQCRINQERGSVHLHIVKTFTLKPDLTRKNCSNLRQCECRDVTQKMLVSAHVAQHSIKDYIYINKVSIDTFNKRLIQLSRQ